MVDPEILPNAVDKKLVRCADCLWWGISDQGYRCDFDGKTVTRGAARSRKHPCPYYIDRDQYLEGLRDRVWNHLMEPLD